MGKIRVTKKPGIWEYVLINDFKDPPYFAYEITDDNGNLKYIPVRKGGKDYAESGPPVITAIRSSRTRYLTDKRRAVITQFLKKTIQEPMKYGIFRSQGWNQELNKYLATFDQFEATQEIIESWLKDTVFKRLIKEIRKKQPGTENTDNPETIRERRITRSSIQGKSLSSPAVTTATSKSSFSPVTTATSSPSSTATTSSPLSTATTLIIPSPSSPLSTSPVSSTTASAISISSSSSPSCSFSLPSAPITDADDLFIPIRVRRSTRKKRVAKCSCCRT